LVVLDRRAAAPTFDSLLPQNLDAYTAYSPAEERSGKRNQLYLPVWC
jgi:hypothetical protein